MHLFRGMSFGLVCITAASCGKPPEPPSRRSEERPASAVAFSRSDSLILVSAKVALPPEGFRPADLPDANSVGAELVAKYCAQCHALPTPSAHSATDWPRVVRRMWLRMDLLPEVLGVQTPMVGERAQLLGYLTDYALVVSGGALPPGKGREAFAKVCSRCHALPDPQVHSAEDWVAVFQRMERNMGRMKVPPPTAEESEGILSYLQSLPRK
jgi:cytochrome c5